MLVTLRGERVNRVIYPFIPKIAKRLTLVLNPNCADICSRKSLISPFIEH